MSVAAVRPAEFTGMAAVVPANDGQVPLPLVAASVPPGNASRRFQHDVRNLFVYNGFTEVYNYSFLSEEAVRAFGFDPAAHIRVTNPIASDQELMRASLLPGVWRNITENAKHRENFRLFEIGLEIHRREEGLPDEIPHLAAAFYDRSESLKQGDGQAGLFELKRTAECLLPGAETVPVEARAILKTFLVVTFSAATSYASFAELSTFGTSWLWSFSVGSISSSRPTFTPS